MNLPSKAIAASALLILIGIGCLSYWSEVRNEEDREWVTHTLLVVEPLQAIRIDIAQAETGQRGYLLTGEEKYLEPYRASLDRLHQDIEQVRNLTLDNPREREALLRLNPLIAIWLAELSDGIEVRKKSGLKAGVEAVAYGNTGGKWMEQIGAQIGEMRKTEAQLLSSRLDRAAASTRKIKVIIAWGNALAILILLVKGFVIHWETRRRNMAELNLKESNARLERRTAELSETNIELESFAYSVAHDLRAPLRHIAGYSGVLTQDYGPRLDAEGLRCLGKIASCAHQMGRLVDELLALSQIGRQELSFQDTALGSLVAQVVEDLAPDLSAEPWNGRLENCLMRNATPGSSSRCS